MRENRFLKVVLIFGMIFLFMLPTCEDKETETFTLSGTITKSGINDGVKVYMKLVSKDAGMTANALYSGHTTFSGGTATYSVTNIEEGEYTLYAFIDVNGNATGTTGSAPDAGDYATSTDVDIEDDTTLNAPENVWSAYQP